jgi:hypothetical protein
MNEGDKKFVEEVLLLKEEPGGGIEISHSDVMRLCRLINELEASGVMKGDA